MRSLRLLIVSVVLLLLSLAVACAPSTPAPTAVPTLAPTATSPPPTLPAPTSTATIAPTATTAPSSVPTATHTPNAAATAASEAVEREFEEIDARNFDRSTVINNQWFPLKPGTRLVYKGSTNRDGKQIAHRVVFTVTDMVKVINGIRAVVIFDLDYKDDQIEEKELTFFAQDNEGNVWHLGQLREVYDGPQIIGGQVWLVGHVENAKAGIMMKARPRLGLPSYSEGYAPPPFIWTDRARIVQMGEKTRVPFGNFEDVLVIEEYSRLEPNAFQYKYYARGVGVVRVGWKGDDPTRETLELTDLFQLSPEAMAEVRAEVLNMERRASMYGRLPSAEQAPATSDYR